MCGRWYVDLMADDELTEYYAKLKNKVGIKTKGEVYPSDYVMVIANDKKSNPSVFNMKWGYEIGKRLVFNARRESLFTKDLFVDGITNRRCVIPANFYYEWQKETKIKNEIKDEKSPILYFLGIYRFEENRPVCTIITKDASSSMKDLHSRMPVIIEKDKINEWLSGQCDVMKIMNESLNDLQYTEAK